MIKTELTIHRFRKYSRNHKYNTHTCALQTLKHFTSQNTQTRYIFPCIRCVYCVHSGIAWTNCTNEPCMSSTDTQTWCSAVYVHSGIELTNCTNETCMSSTYVHTDMVQCGIPGNMVPGYLRSVKGTKAVVRGCGKPGHAPESHKRGTAYHAPPSCQQPDSGAWQRYRSINTFSGSQRYRTMLEGKGSWYSAQKEV